MKKIIVLLALATSFLFAQPKWSLDRSHSGINFTVSHMVVSEVSGTFGDFGVTFESVKDDFSDAKVNVTIKAKSVNTGNEGRDKHLRGVDFFYADKDSIETFKSTKFEKIGNDTYKITGDLTMRGVTKSVTLDAKFKGRAKSPWGQSIIAFKATTTINRKEWGLNWNKILEAGGLYVGENVDLTITLELVQG